MVLAGIVLATAVSAIAQSAAAPELQSSHTVYLQGRMVDFRALNGASTWTLLRTSTAKTAHLLRSKPHDDRPNLYIVAPGTQMHHDDEPGFDHNLVISALPTRPDPAEFDIYYAIILDPVMKDDLHDEREIILAAQQSFHPAEGFKFTDIPGVTSLRVSLSIRTLGELDGFRRADGALPRLIVVPARMFLRAVVQELPPPAAVPTTTLAEAKASAVADGAAKQEPRAESAPEPRPPQ